VLVEVGDDHRSLADGGGAAFDRADVAEGEDAWDARFEQGSGASCGSGPDEALSR
jgi:hypothetical protein